MRFTFTEKKLKSSDALRDYAESKIGKLERLFRSEPEASVTFSMERGRHIAEVTVHCDGMFFRASEATSDMYASIDSAVAAIERQIRKNKTRLAKRIREGSLEQVTEPILLPQEEEEDEPEYEIIRTKRFSIKPMSPEEAILQMNLLGHEFFVFRDQDANEAMAVVYKRKNGGYGIIEED